MASESTPRAGISARASAALLGLFLALAAVVPAHAAEGQSGAASIATERAQTAGRRGPASRLDAGAARHSLMYSVRSWGNQLQELDVAVARAATFDMLVVDAAGGAKGGGGLSKADVEALKSKPDGGRRLLISYLSIGEAEDYRPDYFTAEYMTEDAPDWLLSENEIWKGNRRISFCTEGWQRTILGDDDGRNVYNSIEPSPLYRLIELGVDGVYLDRADVYAEVEKECPNAARQMVRFVARLAAHARKAKPDFVVILQNAEELLSDPVMIEAIDAVAKEDLFYGADHSERINSSSMINDAVRHLQLAQKTGRRVFVLDYLKDPAKRADASARIERLGFLPYFGPRKLDQLWLSAAEGQ